MKAVIKIGALVLSIASAAALGQSSPIYDLDPGATYSNNGGSYSVDGGNHWEYSGPITDRWGTIQETYTSPTNSTQYREYDITVGSDVKTFTNKDNGTYSYQLEICTEYLSDSHSCEELNWTSDVYVSGASSSSSSSSSSSAPCSGPTVSLQSGSSHTSGCDDFYVKADYSLWPAGGPVTDRWGVIKETYLKPDGSSTYRYIEDVSPGVKERINNRASGFYIYTINRCTEYYSSSESCTGFGHQTFVNVQ